MRSNRKSIKVKKSGAPMSFQYLVDQPTSNFKTRYRVNTYHLIILRGPGLMTLQVKAG